MKILFVVFEALLGGHVLSALTVASVMKKQGHQVYFAGKSGKLVPIVRKDMPFFDVDIPVFHGERQTYFTWRSHSAIFRLRQIVRENGIDLVHAFDARSYMHCYPAALLEKIPVLCTLCGGTDPIYNLPRAPKIIVFSGEQKSRMVEHFGWKSDRVEVIRTRLDLGRILSQEMTLDDRLWKEARILPDIPRIMMISSFDDTKILSIFKTLEAAETLLDEGRRLQMILIGGIGGNHDRAMARAEQINARYGRDTIVLTGPVVDAFRLLQAATIVMGVGRSAFEGMAYGKPTVIVGEKGFAGVVGEEGINNIAYYNFSGRNVRNDVPASVLTEQIARLLDDPQSTAIVGEFGKEFVMREIDVRLGAERIEAIYATVGAPQGFFKRICDWASFVTALVPICYDNWAHRPKEFIKGILEKFTIARGST